MAAEPLYHEDEHVGWAHPVGDGAIATDLNGTITGGLDAEGDLMDADEDSRLRRVP